MKLVKISINRPVTVTMLMVTLVLFGFVSYQRLPINLLPDLSYPTITIRTEYEGTAPEEMETLVSRPIEETVSIVDGVVKVSSSSRSGVSEVTIEFEWGTQMDFASLDVREKLDRITLPEDAEQPILLRYDPSLEPIMKLGLTAADSVKGYGLSQLRTLAEERLKPKLETVEGVAAIVVSGGLEEEIHVSISESKLSALGMSVETVTRRVQEENINLTGGTLRDGGAEYLVRTINQFKTPDEIKDIVIEKREGALIRLRDVANVTTGHKDRTVITELNGRENIELAVNKEADANTVLVARRVKERIKEVLDEFGPEAAGERGIALTTITDQSSFISNSIKEVLITAAFGGILAVFVLYIFLQQLSVTLIISLAIPICVIATFFFMYLSGVTLNIMSLGGLALGVGMLVDNSIVVLESIDRFRKEGMDSLKASYEGASLVGNAVTASTITTICVFLPIIFVSGIAGQLFTDQSLTVTYSLLASLLVSLTLIPMLSSGFGGGRKFGGGRILEGDIEGEHPESPEVKRILDKQRERDSSKPEVGFFNPPVVLKASWLIAPLKVVWFIFYLLYFVVKWIFVIVFKYIPLILLSVIKFSGLASGTVLGTLLKPFLWLHTRFYTWLEASYKRSLDVVLRNRLTTIIIALAVFGGSLMIYPRLGMELIPEMSQGEIMVGVKMPVGTPVEETSRVLAIMEEIALQYPEVKLSYATAGMSSLSGGSLSEQREDIGQLNLILQGQSSRAGEDLLIEQLRQRYSVIPSVSVKFSRPVLYSFKTPVELEVRGYNLETLGSISRTLVERMGEVRGLTDIKSSLEGGNPEIRLEFRRERLATLGLTLNDIAAAVRSKVLGDIPTELYRTGRKIDIRVRLEEADRDRLADIRNLTIATVGGRPIPLSAVADLVIREGPSEIKRVDQERVVLISANLDNLDLATANRELERIIREEDLPPAISATIGGQGLEMDRSMKSMLFAICLAAFLVYLVMASQFESLLHPFVIMFTIPFGLVGVIWSLYLTTGVVSVVALIGVVMLSGIVVNNAIVLVDYVNILRRDGHSKFDALKIAGEARLRPILMTTMTTVLGLLPMAIGLGEGSEVRAPMAIVVIGGLMVATFMTLLLLPTMYSLLDWRD